MKKFIGFLVGIVSILSISSCASVKTNKVYINDYNEQMNIVKVNFPQIYDLYIQGKVIIDGVYTYTIKKTGEERVHISYRYL